MHFFQVSVNKSGKLFSTISVYKIKAFTSYNLLRLHFPRKQWQHTRLYHCNAGIYGYQPPKQSLYKVPDEVLESRIKQSNFYNFVCTFRQHGHKLANVNPVAIVPESQAPELDLHRFGLSENDTVAFNGILSTTSSQGTVAEAVAFLHKAYSDKMSAEFSYLEDEQEREWFAHQMEYFSQEELDDKTRINLATEIIKSQAFDNFMATKFVTVKRYGGEGAESMMAFFLALFNSSAEAGVEELIMSMPHRGRLNLLTGMLQFPPAQLFRKLKGISEFPEDANATGDVPSHFTSSIDLRVGNKHIHITMLPGPSHLEISNPVSMGKTRARQQSFKEGGYSNGTSNWSDKILNIQVHGDAAFIGQGVNQETLELSQVPHFEVGGTIHLIVNNQLGFTTPAEMGRSSRYCSDLAKIISAPVIHVNGDCPEMVIKATKIACEYQRIFRKDVFVDLNCYRQWGHNELDDPTFTNPAVYGIIHARRTVPDIYADELIGKGIMVKEDVSRIVSEHSGWLNDILKNIENFIPKETYLQKQWKEIQQADACITSWDTGIEPKILKYIAQKSVDFPEDFSIHPHLLKTHVKNRLAKAESGTNIDWATAEAMAFGTLLYQGYNVRISGQDVGRGTFSHRHVMLVDQKTNNTYIPLNNLIEDQNGHLEVANSILSEEAVLAYEYGMSIESPNNLIIWEAQFGDFFNGAQIPIDTYVTSGETKWMMFNGLVIMLPHGYDGAGPEHSSCRMERFLQLSDSCETKPDGDNVNIHIANPTTPAQYFHLLRRQMLRNFRKPLILVTPKTLLRMPDATSNLEEMGPQTTFHPVLGGIVKDYDMIRRVILTSGKHYYALEKQRKALEANDVAIIRVELLSPFPTLQIQQEVAKYRNAKLFIWSQEEHQNMGPWSFIRPRFENLVGKRLKYCGRGPLATPAVGIGLLHQKEVQEVIETPFKIR